MDKKQKQRLRFYRKARRRANKVLAKRHELEHEKQVHEMRKETSQELKNRYTLELTTIAQESGILPMAELAALQCGGLLTQDVNYYIYYGPATSSLQQTAEIAQHGELRASYMALRITWGESETVNEVEIRVHKNGLITFHNSYLPLFRFVWRRNHQLLQKMLTSALEHPRQRTAPVKSGAQISK